MGMAMVTIMGIIRDKYFSFVILLISVKYGIS